MIKLKDIDRAGSITEPNSENKIKELEARIAVLESDNEILENLVDWDSLEEEGDEDTEDES